MRNEFWRSVCIGVAAGAIGLSLWRTVFFGGALMCLIQPQRKPES